MKYVNNAIEQERRFVKKKVPGKHCIFDVVSAPQMPSIRRLLYVVVISGEGSRLRINGELDMEITNEAAAKRETMLLAHELRPDVLMLNISMPGRG